MPITLQGRIDPLQYNLPIVDPETGRPSAYFIRQWREQQQVNSGSAAIVAALEELETTVTALQADVTALEGRNINTTAPLQGGGDLSADRTLSIAASGATPGTYGDATNVAQITVDAFGRITGVADVPISGGGGGSGPPQVCGFTNDTYFALSSSDATHGGVFRPAIDMDLQGVFAVLQDSAANRTFEGYILEVNSSDEILSIVGTTASGGGSVYQNTSSGQPRGVFCVFDTPVSVSGGSRYILAITRTDGGTSDPPELGYSAGTTEGSFITVPCYLSTSNAVTLASTAPAVSDTFSGAAGWAAIFPLA